MYFVYLFILFVYCTHRHTPAIRSCHCGNHGDQNLTGRDWQRRRRCGIFEQLLFSAVGLSNDDWLTQTEQSQGMFWWEVEINSADTWCLQKHLQLENKASTLQLFFSQTTPDNYAAICRNWHWNTATRTYFKNTNEHQYPTGLWNVLVRGEVNPWKVTFRHSIWN